MPDNASTESEPREKSFETVLREFQSAKDKKTQNLYLKTISSDFVRKHYESLAVHQNALVRKHAARQSLETPDAFQGALRMLVQLIAKARDAVIARSLLDSSLLLLGSPKGKKLLKTVSYLDASRVVTAVLNMITIFRLVAPKNLAVVFSDNCLTSICVLDVSLSGEASVLLLQNIPPATKQSVLSAIFRRYVHGSPHLRGMAFHIIETSGPEHRKELLGYALGTISERRTMLPKAEITGFLHRAASADWLDTGDLQSGLLQAAETVFSTSNELQTKIDCILVASKIGTTQLAPVDEITSTFAGMVRFLSEPDAHKLLAELQSVASSASDSPVDLSFGAACMQKMLQSISLEDMPQAEESLIALLKKLARNDPAVALASINVLAAGPQREGVNRAYFRSLRESEQDDDQKDGNLAKLSGQLLQSSDFNTQLATIEWILEMKKENEDFWISVLDHAGFSRLWQSLVFDIARNGEETLSRLKKEFVSDGFRQGRESATTFFLEKVKLVLRAINELNVAVPPRSSGADVVVDVRNDLAAFLDQLNIKSFGTIGETVAFDPTKHEDVDSSLEVGETGVLSGCGYVVGDGVSKTQVLVKAPIGKPPA